MNKERKRMVFMAGLMVISCLATVAAVLFFISRLHMDHVMSDLTATAQSQARLIEAIARYDRKYDNDYPGNSRQATLTQIKDAHAKYRGFGETGEFVLAHREGDNIVFEFRHGRKGVEVPDSIPFDSKNAEPMQRALSGLSGTMIGRDYRGKRVAAAYEPVDVMDMGIVAKMDMAEFSAPFIDAGLIALGITLVVVSISVALFFRMGSPMVQKIEKYADSLEQEVAERKSAEELLQLIIDSVPALVSYIDKDYRYRFVNKGYGEWFGVATEQTLGTQVSEVIGDEALKSVKPELERALNGEAVGYEREIKYTTGSRWTRSRFVPDVDDDGRAKGLVAFVEDITERKKAEEREKHLSLVLRAIRNVNQLITVEKDRDRLIRGACQGLVETRGFYNCWIVLTNGGQKAHKFADSGLADKRASFKEMLDKGVLPPCAEKALQRNEMVVTRDPASECPDCPLAAPERYEGQAALAMPLEHEGTTYGTMSLSLPADYIDDPEELSLYKEVVSDIAFALRSIEAEEQKAHAEEELRQSEEFSRSLIESMADGLSVLDDKGAHMEVNEALCGMTGFSREELIGTGPPHPYWPEEEYESIGEIFNSVMDEDFKSHELTFKRKSGERFPVIVSPSQITDELGNVKSYFATVKDITDLKNVEQRLKDALFKMARQESETRGLFEAARSVLESSGFEESARKIFDVCREATGAMSGYVALLSGDGSENELLFLDSGGLACTVDENLPMPIRGLRAEAYSKADVVCDNDFMNSEWVKFMPEGHVELKNVLFSPLTINEEVVGVIGLANKPEDFNEDDERLTRALGDMAAIALRRARYEEELEERQTLLDQVGEMASIGGWELDVDTKSVKWTSQTYRIHEVSEDEPIGLDRAITFFDLPERKTLEEALERCMEEGGAFDFELPFTTATGKKLWIRAMGRAVQAGEKITKLQGVFQDITELKQLEEQLNQAMKMEAIGRLAGGVAHDFNNALTPLMVISGALLKELDPQQPIYQDIKEIQEAAERCTSLTRQLLAFGRRQALDLEVLNLNDVVANIEKMLGRLIGEDVKLVKFLNEDLGNVKADVGQMEQILANLAVNARDAMPKGGKLTIETDNVYLDEDYAATRPAVHPGPHVMMAVSDTGTGMDEETRLMIFEPFFTTKEKDKGTGLGLSTVYGIVKQMGGNVWCYSEPGEGTTFKIYLPQVSEGAEGPRSREIPAPETYHGTETVLVVEDEENVRKVAKRILEDQGYRVLEAESGESALQICERLDRPADFLLTDVVMPGMSGKELADRLSAKCPDMKILYISGYTDNAIVHHGVLDAGTNFLQKPFTAESLARKVREVLDG